MERSWNINRTNNVQTDMNTENKKFFSPPPQIKATSFSLTPPTPPFVNKRLNHLRKHRIARQRQNEYTLIGLDRMTTDFVQKPIIIFRSGPRSVRYDYDRCQGKR